MTPQKLDKIHAEISELIPSITDWRMQIHGDIIAFKMRGIRILCKINNHPPYMSKLKELLIEAIEKQKQDQEL